MNRQKDNSRTKARDSGSAFRIGRSRMFSLVLIAFAGTVFADGKHAYEIPLLNAIKEGHTNTVRQLLAKGTDVNVVEKDRGWSALMFACYNNDEDLVDGLLKAGADTRCRGYKWDRQTPVSLAVERGNTNLLVKLLKAGADVHARDVFGISPLMKARSMNRAGMVEVLVKHGAKEFELVVPKEALKLEDAEMLFYELTQVGTANGRWFARNEERFKSGYQVTWNDIATNIATNLPIFLRGGKDMLGNSVVFGRRPPGTRHEIQTLAVSTNTVDVMRRFTGGEEETKEFWGSYYPIELKAKHVER